MDKPVVFLAFANDKDAYLENLEREEDSIYQKLQPLIDLEAIQVYSRGRTTIEDIYQQFNRFRKKIVIFHYGGHAGSTTLHLKGKTAQAKGLAELLANQKNLKLVFLNGCSTKEQVEYLLHLGVPAVIATSVPINDKKATDFAIQFYQSLVSGATLKESFEEAVSRLRTEKQLTDNQAEYRFLGAVLTEKNINIAENPWGFFVRKKTVENWKIPKQKPKPILTYFLTSLIGLLGLALVGSWYWEQSQPFNQIVKIKNLSPNPEIAFEMGKITLKYGEKTEVLNIEDEVIFKSIPPNFKTQPVNLLFESEGFIKLDTNFILNQKLIEIGIKRDNSLGIIKGKIIDSETNEGIKAAKISIDKFTTNSDSLGNYELIIPFAYQKKEYTNFTVFHPDFITQQGQTIYRGYVYPNNNNNIPLTKKQGRK